VQFLEVSGAVRPIHASLGVKWLSDVSRPEQNGRNQLWVIIQMFNNCRFWEEPGKLRI